MIVEILVTSVIWLFGAVIELLPSFSFKIPDGVFNLVISYIDKLGIFMPFNLFTQFLTIEIGYLTFKIMIRIVRAAIGTVKGWI